MLIVAPWSSFWDRNFFVERLPATAEWVNHPIARGAVSGIGLVTTLAGLVEFGAAFGGRRTQSGTSPEQSVPSDR